MAPECARPCRSHSSEEAVANMMPMMRQEIEVLLDTQHRHDYVVSAYADLTVQNGFERHVELHLKNQARAVGDALAEAKARRDLDANIDVIRESVRQQNHA